MKLPGFTAQVSLGRVARSYRGSHHYGPSTAGDVWPAQFDMDLGEEIELLENMEELEEPETEVLEEE